MKKRKIDLGPLKGWLYLLPALLFLGVFMVYPLIDVFIYSFEEGYNFASGTFLGVGGYNYSYVLRDPYFIAALKNTFLLVIITVPLSTIIAILISVGLNAINPLRNFLRSLYFLPYVTNTLAVGLVFMILFKKTPDSVGFINLLLSISLIKSALAAKYPTTLSFNIVPNLDNAVSPDINIPL